MTTITAQVVADSEAEGHRFTTMVLRYPRFVHEELLMYGTFARSCASSRAKPTAKWLGEIESDPAKPIFWTKNQKGMQGEPFDCDAADLHWEDARDAAVQYADALRAYDVHKQDANRLLHPFQHIDVVLSGTQRSYMNLFSQRLHEDAMPTFRALAWQMAEAYFSSKPEELAPHDWHLPFVTKSERTLFKDEVVRRFSAARCARTSYSNHDGSDPDHLKDMELFNKLASRKKGEWNPVHGNPLEHQVKFRKDCGGRFGDWVSFRTAFGATFEPFDEEKWRRYRAKIAEELGITLQSTP